jgi:serine/threonine protein kinase
MTASLENEMLTSAHGREVRRLPAEFGRYTLLKQMGTGGMGAVYLAEERMLHRQVAVKILSRQFASETELVSRFKREGRAAVQLRHPNLVPAYEVGEEGGELYYAMEFCEGESLDAVLDRMKCLPAPQVLEIVCQVARGLVYAHEQGVVHRDIKPGNIVLTKEGAVKVLDLGLSKNLYDVHRSFQTMDGTTLGTPEYMSPEQAQGLTNSVDGRTDQYSLGATMYHLLTGVIPFSSTSPGATLLQQVTGQLADPRELKPDIAPGLVTVLAKMMAKDPADRYANLNEVLKELDRVKHRIQPTAKPLDPKLTSIAARRAAHATTQVGAQPSRVAVPYSWLIAAGVLAGVAALIVVVLYCSLRT